MNPTETNPFPTGESGGATDLREGRAFDFRRDAFAFANETKWRYSVDPVTGRQVSTARVPEPDYTLHCFAMVRSARQFWLHARFEPSLLTPDEATCRRLVREVVSRSVPATCSRRPDQSNATGGDYKSPAPVVIPGYAGLREFSTAREALLKGECGGAWRSYFQRGNWRMVLPFTRGHQQSEAAMLVSELQHGALPIVHVLRFPQLTINHTLLLFGAQETSQAIEFHAYDPNVPERPVMLTYDRTTRTFTLPPLHYFAGGRVDVYEIYRGWIY